MLTRLLAVLILMSLLAGCAPRQTPRLDNTDTPELRPTLPYPGPSQLATQPGVFPEYPAPGSAPTASPVIPGEIPGGGLNPLPIVTQGAGKMLTRGNVFIDAAQILTLESFPPQFVLSLEGSLPTPCHQLGTKVNPPDSQNRIEVEVYSLVDPEMVCIQVLEPFVENVPLGSLPKGEYTVLVNGEKAGEIQAP